MVDENVLRRTEAVMLVVRKKGRGERKVKQTNDVVVDATHLGLEITVSETILVHVPEALDKLEGDNLCVGF